MATSPNPFAAHSNLMAQYQQMITQPIDGTQNQAQQGTIVYNGQTYPAVISHSLRQNRQDDTGAGFTPGLMLEAIVQKNVLPAGIAFAIGQQVTATQVGGQVYQCQILDVDDEFAEWRLELMDLNEGA